MQARLEAAQELRAAVQRQIRGAVLDPIVTVDGPDDMRTTWAVRHPDGTILAMGSVEAIADWIHTLAQERKPEPETPAQEQGSLF